MTEYSVKQLQFIDQYRQTQKLGYVLSNDAVVELIKKDIEKTGNVYPGFEYLGVNAAKNTKKKSAQPPFITKDVKLGSVFGFGYNTEISDTQNSTPSAVIPMRPDLSEIVDKFKEIKTDISKADVVLKYIHKDNVLDIITKYKEINGTSLFEDLLQEIPSKQAERDKLGDVLNTLYRAIYKDKNGLLINMQDSSTSNKTKGHQNNQPEFTAQSDDTSVRVFDLPISDMYEFTYLETKVDFKTLLALTTTKGNDDIIKKYIAQIEKDVETRKAIDSKPLLVHVDNATNGYSFAIDVAQGSFDYQLDHNGVTGWIANYIAYLWDSDNVAHRVQNDINTASKYVNELQNCRTKGEFEKKFKEIFKKDYDSYSMDKYTKLRQQYQQTYQAHLTERMFLYNFSDILNNEKLKDHYAHIPTNRQLGEGAYDQLLETRQQKYDRYVKQYNNYLNNVEKKGSFDEELEAVGLSNASLDEKYEFLRNLIIFRYNMHHADTVRACNGRKYEDVEDEYNKAYIKAFGNNEIMRRVDEYNMSQQKGAQYVKMTAVAAACIATGALTAGAGSLPILGGLTTSETLTVAAIGGLTSSGLELADQTANVFYQAITSDDNFSKAFDDAFAKEMDLGKALKSGAATAGTIIAFSIAGQPAKMVVDKLIPIPKVASGASTSEVFNALKAQSLAMSATNFLMMEGAEYIMTGKITWEGTVFAVAVTVAGQILSINKINTQQQTIVEEQYKPEYRRAKHQLGLSGIDDSKITEPVLKNIKRQVNMKLHPDRQINNSGEVPDVMVEISIDGEPVKIRMNTKNIGELNIALDIVEKYTVKTSNKPVDMTTQEGKIYARQEALNSANTREDFVAIRERANLIPNIAEKNKLYGIYENKLETTHPELGPNNILRAGAKLGGLTIDEFTSVLKTKQPDGKAFYATWDGKVKVAPLDIANEEAYQVRLSKPKEEYETAFAEIVKIRRTIEEKLEIELKDIDALSYTDMLDEDINFINKQYKDVIQQKLNAILEKNGGQSLPKDTILNINDKGVLILAKGEKPTLIYNKDGFNREAFRSWLQATNIELERALETELPSCLSLKKEVNQLLLDIKPYLKAYKNYRGVVKNLDFSIQKENSKRSVEEINGDKVVFFSEIDGERLDGEKEYVEISLADSQEYDNVITKEYADILPSIEDRNAYTHVKHRLFKRGGASIDKVRTELDRIRSALQEDNLFDGVPQLEKTKGARIGYLPSSGLSSRERYSLLIPCENDYIHVVLSKDLKIVTYIHPLEQPVVDRSFKALIKNNNGYIFVNGEGEIVE